MEASFGYWRKVYGDTTTTGKPPAREKPLSRLAFFSQNHFRNYLSFLSEPPIKKDKKIIEYPLDESYDLGYTV